MKRFSDRLIPILASTLMRVLFFTMRIRHVNEEEARNIVRGGSSFILAFWHAHLLLMVFANYRRPIVTMISRHRDGELIARTVAKFGARSARGSTTRGGSTALRGLIEAAREGATLAITPDGPRGPRHVAQMGVVQAAQATGLAVVPTAFISRPRWQLRSWDRFEVPWPFSRGMFIYGEPIHVPRKVSRDEMEEFRAKIERDLCALSRAGESRFEEIWKRRGI